MTASLFQIRGDRGQTLLEYALILAVISIVLTLVLLELKDRL